MSQLLNAPFDSRGVVYSEIECFRFVYVTGLTFWRKMTLFTGIVILCKFFFIYEDTPTNILYVIFYKQQYHIPKSIYNAPKIRMTNA